ncbi:MAG: hypothetical protein MI920_02235 [Kiloniellales bacterium]|nr:hypothetical protein [Kiloniellales bacterium]
MIGPNVGRLLGILVLATQLGACASIVSDNDSTTYIATQPEGARCELHGQDFTRVVMAPSSVSLPADAAPITVACKSDGYRTTTAELDTSMDGWIVGNLIFGGIIGAAIDASRGAGQKYPAQLTVYLDPDTFDSEAERDEWYETRIGTLKNKWGELIDAEERKCERDSTELCRRKVEELEEARDKEVEELIKRRDTSIVNQ